MNKGSRKFFSIIFIFLLLLISLGFAYLSSSLNIIGNATVRRNTWNVYWDNVQVTNGSVSGTNVTTPATINTNKTQVSFSIVLSTPGDFYEFTVDAVNGGTIDAMIDSIESLLNDSEITSLPSYLNYTVSYYAGDDIEERHLLAANTTETYRVRVEYNKDISANDLPTTDQNLSFSFSVNYVQSTSSAEAPEHLAYFCANVSGWYDLNYSKEIDRFFSGVEYYPYEYGMSWFDYYNSDYFDDSAFIDNSTSTPSLNLPEDFLYYDRRFAYVSNDNLEYVELYNDYVSTDKIMPKTVGCYGTHLFYGE